MTDPPSVWEASISSNFSSSSFITPTPSLLPLVLAWHFPLPDPHLFFNLLKINTHVKSQSPDIPVISSRTVFSLSTTSYRPNPRSRTFTCCRYAHRWKSSCLLLTPKIKLLMILPPSIVSVLHVISHHHSISDKFSQGCVYGFPPNPVKCPLTVLRVFFRYQFAPHQQDQRLYHERSLTIIGRRFHRHVMW